VKKLARVDGLRERVGKAESGHRFVGELRVDAEVYGFVQGGDKAQSRADRGQVDVASRLVGFGL
jgi:hypothetical protein